MISTEGTGNLAFILAWQGKARHGRQRRNSVARRVTDFHRATIQERAMKDVIARLKASRTRTNEEARLRGREKGLAWARETAETVELERLDQWTGGRFDHHGSWADFLMDRGDGNEVYGRDHDLAEAVARKDGDEFWSSVLGDDDSDRYLNPFLVGFVEGAIEVWGAVKGQP
jgi:hypothetical protein